MNYVPGNTWESEQSETSVVPCSCGLETSEDLVLGALGHTRSSFISNLIQENEDLKSQLNQSHEKISKLHHERTHLLKIIRHRNEMDQEQEEQEEQLRDQSFTLPDSLGRNSFSLDVNSLMKKLDGQISENKELDEKLSYLSTCNRSLEEGLEEMKQETSDLKRKLKNAEALKDKVIVQDKEIAQQWKEVAEQREKIVHLESLNRELLSEMEELEIQLERSKEDKEELLQKVEERENRYQECRMLLEEQKAANSSLRHEQRPKVLRYVSNPNSPYVSTESISAEIEESLRLRRKRRNSENIHQNKRVLNMIHLVSLAHKGRIRSNSEGYSIFYTVPSLSRAPSEQHLEGSTTVENEEADKEQCQESHDYEAFAPNISFVPLGCPGRPGSLDLELALGLKLHLSPLQTGQLAELFEDDDDDESREDSDSDGHNASPCSSNGGNKFSSNHSDKLRLVKPMEGSLTLFQWHRLSTPGLGKILESREGIQVKGEEQCHQFELADHSLSDYEDDDVDTTECNNNNAEASDCTQCVDSSSSSLPRDSSTKKSRRRNPKKWEKSKHTDAKEMFILLNATQLPLSSLVCHEIPPSPSESQEKWKRVGCVIS